MRKRIVFFWLCISVLFITCAYAQIWQENRSTHFIVYYKNAPEYFIRQVADRAEIYYNNIADDLGFRRYDFWTWDNRAQIYIYDNSADYQASTGLPGWSAGAVEPKGKTIQAFPYAQGFFETTLPHELGHIIFREFVGFNNRAIPIWFEEGVASYQEKLKYARLSRMLKKAVENKTFIPLSQLANIDIYSSKDNNLVELFYAEAFSAVDYLINKFGRDKFVSFCQNLRDYKNFVQALSSVYPFDSVEELDKDWQRYLSE